MQKNTKNSAQKLVFSFYKPEEIEKISVVEVLYPLAFDRLHNPIENGLHDRRMGPILQETKCITCDLNKVHCKGHYGHINFPIPIYNPLAFNTLLPVIKNMCTTCNKLILPIHLREQIEHNFDLILKENGLTENILTSKKMESRLENIKFNEEATNIITGLSARRCPFCEFKPKKYMKKRYCILTEKQQFVLPEEIKLKLMKIFENDIKVIRSIFNHNNIDMFFITKMLILPNKFRPLNNLNGDLYENFHNWSLVFTLKHIVLYKEQNDILEKMRRGEYEDPVVKKTKTVQKPKTIGTQVASIIEIVKNLQFSVVCYFYLKSPSQSTDNSIKNVLEKKEGLFRQNLMGKRVNYAGRSVIIPDPNLEAREVGIPLLFAKILSFKENVTPFNVSYLKTLVINGVNNYPGANFVEENGVMKNLKFISLHGRKIIAANLLIGKKAVHRQMRNGDVVLLNRQPTLHKPSLMAHTIRVLNERVIRLHYSNCSAYNADFDGDEMNIHFLQDHLSRAEAYTLCTADENYFNTNFQPVVGLIQDHIVMAQQLTLKHKLLTEDEFKYLINVKFDVSVWGKEFLEKPIKILKPAIYRPRKIYTGKQVFSLIFYNLDFNFNYQNFNKYKNLLHDKDEEVVLIKNGVLLTGLVDKSQLGASHDSFIHIIGELYGFDKAGNLLSIVSRVLNRLLIKEGYSFSIFDFKLTKEAEIKRKVIYESGMKRIIENMNKYKDKYSEMDQKRDINSISTQILESLQNLSINKFPYNNFANLIQSGAKGSTVNLSHITGLLGQQELEGQRVNLSANGYTLPMFKNTYPPSRGHVFGRFLTGIAPHEYFFHSMAGREGLIDTAIKTSKSGYLQRCLIKTMEGIKVEYDQTVRYSKGIIQFQYHDNCIRKIKDLSKNIVTGKNEKYANRNLTVSPGENVGALCAQSLGEPSTQMTLNTFHLAGVGGLNVTLGMPRLKELIMLGLKTKTVVISLPLGNETDTEKLVKILQRFNKLTMQNIIEKLKIVEENKPEATQRQFTVKFELRERISIAEKTLFEQNFLSAFHKKAKSSSSEIQIKKQVGIDKGAKDDESELGCVVEPERESTETEAAEKGEDTQSEDNIKEAEKESSVEDRESSKEEKTDDLETSESLSIFECKEYLKNREQKADKIHLNTDEKNIKKFNIKFSLALTEITLPITLTQSIIETLVVRYFGVSRILKNQNFLFFEESDYLSVMKIFQQAKEILNSINLPLAKLLDDKKIIANDVKTTFEFLGIEAARQVLLDEIQKVFSGYGITVDIRHLVLLVDFLTQRGQYLGANRFHIDESLIQRVSFESAYKNLKEACVFMEEDHLKNPSSLVAVGQRIKGGTGIVELEFDYDAIR
ncbi:DNA-directed RNA polymerase I subunit RPA1 [Cucumispora dikerogammari]|nr:DNA-directed RNA polymerase I subunit RPA1 [Cucumispora dikerogammari]